jgi:phage-related protein
MTTFEIFLVVTNLLTLVLYVTSKYKEGTSLTEVIKEVKRDIKNSSEVVSELVTKATDIVFDESIQKTIKEFIMIVEEKNQLAKQKGESFLLGDEKKYAVIKRLSEWVANLSGSTEKAVKFVEDNQSKIESIIDDYISFSNKMHGKSTLSEAEKIIADKLSNKEN